MRSIDGYLTTEDGVRLFYQKLGSGAHTVIIPNGWYLLEDFSSFDGGDRTLIAYDLRNRGRSDAVTDDSKLARGIHQDVDDLETVRHHFGSGRVDLIGHSYIGVLVALYAMKYPQHLGRAVQIAPSSPAAAKQYPAHWSGADATRAQVFAKLAQLRQEPRPEDPVEACRKFWSVLRELYVVDPADAERIDWGRCELPNERNFMKYWTGIIFPSLQRLDFRAEGVAQATAPVLTIHGTKDRSAPYGGGRDWARMLPNARLVTVEEAGHAPWIENPAQVFDSIDAFLKGAWPEAAQKVTEAS